MAGRFTVEVGELYGLAQTLTAQANTTAEEATVPVAESGNAQVDAALSELVSRWSTQTQALGDLAASLAVALGAAAINYAETDQQTASSLRPERSRSR